MTKFHILKIILTLKFCRRRHSDSLKIIFSNHGLVLEDWTCLLLTEDLYKPVLLIPEISTNPVELLLILIELC